MFFEEKFEKNEHKFNQLSIHIQRLNDEFQKMLLDMNLTSEQLKNFTENPDNFPSETWEELQNEKKSFKERLNLELNNIRDINRSKQTFSERGEIQRHWVFVR